MGMKECDRAAEWRIRCELSQRELSERIGYARMTISFYELGRNPKSPNRSGVKIKPQVWQRFKRACGDLDAELNGRAKGQRFDW